MTDIELRLTADTVQATKGINGFRKVVDDLNKTLQKPIRDIDALKVAQESAKKTSTEFFAAKKKVEDLKNAMAQAGQPVRGLAQDLAKAERVLSATTISFERQRQAIRQQRAELKAAGVDTRNLASEQQRLNAELSSKVSDARGKASLSDSAARLNVTQLRAGSAAIKQAQRDYELLRASGTLTARELAVAQQALNVKIRETTKEMKALQTEQSKGSSLANKIGGSIGVVGAAYGAVSALRAYVDITDTAKKMEAQLKLATTSQEEFSRAQADTFKIAQDGQVPLEQVVATYARLAPALDDIGRRGDAGKVVDALTKSLRINGSSSAESASTLLQFSQAMGSGVLRGEEFNAIAEAAPPLLRAFAKGLGVPTGALRGMAAEGLLTAEVITDLAVNALPELTEAAAQLPDTVDGALTRLRNDLSKAFGEGDTSGLINSITELRALLTDPAVVQGLNDLAGGMITLAGWTAKVASGFSRFASEAGYAAAVARGYVDELDQIDKKLKEYKEDPKGGSFFGIRFDLSDEIEKLERQRLELQAKMAGMTVEAYQAAQAAEQANLDAKKNAADEGEQIDKERFSEYSKYLSDTKGVQDTALADSKKFLSARVAAERAAGKELASAQKAQLDTQKRYANALANLSSGGSSDPSYAQAQNLKLKAQEALRKGDLAGAKSSAQAALKVLEELQAAGENTYGFEGFINSLKAVEDEADKIRLDKAEKSIEAAKDKTKELKDLLESIKSTTISVKMDQASLDLLRSQLQKLKNLTGLDIAVPSAVANPNAKPAASMSSPMGAGIDPPAFSAPISQQVVPAKAKIRQDGNSFTNLPAVPVDIVPTGIRQQDDGTFTNLPAVPVDITPKDIRQDGENSFTNLPAVGVELEVDKDAAAAAQAAISSLSTQFRQQMQIAVVPVVQGGVGAVDASLPAAATGGIIRGPGTGTSDSIMTRLSNGEGVLNARAVEYWGSGLVHQLNRLQMPKFADGGVVGGRVPSIPAFNPAAGRAAAPNFPHLGRFDFGFEGSTYQMYAPPDVASELQSLALKRGRTKR